MKTCKKCKETKNYSDFYSHKDTSDSLHPYCKECVKEDRRKYRKEHPEKVKASRIKHTYKISYDQVKEMAKEQNNACAICFSKTSLVIDHCHTTGSVRGLLCSECNLMLGKSKDNIDRLRNAIAYLERFK